MRLFVGVELDDRLRDALAALVIRLRERAAAMPPHARISRVTPDRLHLTVSFIGQASEVQAAAASMPGATVSSCCSVWSRIGWRRPAAPSSAVRISRTSPWGVFVRQRACARPPCAQSWKRCGSARAVFGAVTLFDSRTSRTGPVDVPLFRTGIARRT